MDLIYFDNAASTKPLNIVNSSFETINTDYYANPSSSHTPGIEAEKMLERSRDDIARFLNVKQNEIIFTSGGTESINLALRGIYKTHSKKRQHIITSSVEHSAVYETLMDLSNEGAEITFIDPQNGKMLPQNIYNALNENTLMISLIHVNNESGVINPIKEIAYLVKEYNKNIFIHVDAIQSFGKIDLKEEIKNVDMISCSAHKIHGPKGIGFLYLKNNVRMRPIITGGGQEKGIRSGTTNLPLINAFASVVLETKENYINDFMHVKDLDIYLKESLIRSNIKHVVNFPEDTSPYISSISFPGTRSEVLMHYLEMENIIVSAGAACSSKKKKNRVLENYNISKEKIESTIRISFSRFSKKDEIDRLIFSLNSILPKITR